ncbi:MAG: DNA-directed RNA polymerase subunit N [Thermosphaera sp.]
MLFPVRCFTCGAPIGHLWEEYEKKVKAGEDPGKVLDELGVKRYCCRRMFLSYVDVSKEVLQFPKIS